MPVPDFQSMMLPLLRQFGDGKEHSLHEILDQLARVFSLTEQEINELLPSGKQTTFYQSSGLGKNILYEIGFIGNSHHAHYRITERGKKVLKSNPTRIDMKYLEQFPEYIEFKEKEGTQREARKKAMTMVKKQDTP